MIERYQITSIIVAVLLFVFFFEYVMGCDVMRCDAMWIHSHGRGVVEQTFCGSNSSPTLSRAPIVTLVSTTMHTNWIYLAVASGLCAAINGLFAKLTTTTLTTSFSSALAGLLSLPQDSKAVEYAIRGVSFSLSQNRGLAIKWGVGFLCAKPAV